MCVFVCVCVVGKLDEVVPLVSMSPSPHAGIVGVVVSAASSDPSGTCALLGFTRNLPPLLDHSGLGGLVKA